MPSLSRIFAGVLASLSLLFMLAFGTGAANDLYRAQAIVTGQGEENRAFGVATALQEVLAKVSGDPRLVDDPRVAALAGQAGTWVAGFSYRDRMAGIPVHDEQGTRDRPYDLTVRFHPAKIDAALRSLGSQAWTDHRPRVALVLAVRNGSSAYLLAADGKRGRDLREALAAAARRFGMPVLLPDEAALAMAGLNLAALLADPAGLKAIAKSAGGEVALAGSLLWSDEALGWIAEWRLDSKGKIYRWQIAGVSFDAALRSAVGGTAQILSGHGQPD